MDDRSRPSDQVDHFRRPGTLNWIFAIARLIPKLEVLDAVLKVTDNEPNIVEITQNLFLRFKSLGNSLPSLRMVCLVPKIEDIGEDNTVLDHGVNLVVEPLGNEEFVRAVIDGRLHLLEGELQALQTQVYNWIQVVLRQKVAINSSYAVILKFS